MPSCACALACPTEYICSASPDIGLPLRPMHWLLPCPEGAVSVPCSSTKVLGLVIQLTSQHELQCLMAVLALWAMTVSNGCLQATQRTLGFRDAHRACRQRHFWACWHINMQNQSRHDTLMAFKSAHLPPQSLMMQTHHRCHAVSHRWHRGQNR